MAQLSDLYRHSLSLLTDLYQLTMAYGYWKQGRASELSVFHLYFRKNPFQGGYTVACGLDQVVQFLSEFRFTSDDIQYLASLSGNDARPLFDAGFLDYLRTLELTCDVDAVPEGTVVFPNEPLVRVQGPLLQCQLLETALLNLVNFQTLIATKAARVCEAARGEPVLEFGLRRAQGIDGGLSASRASYIGGCAATSNVLAGKLFGIPVRGTHAHSWVMSYDTEAQAFSQYAEAMPNNCVFLVDTYNTLEGVRGAAREGRRLRERGYDLAGIRLDSGDLAWLSIEARKILDAEGFPGTSIVASNDLDEYLITSLKEQGARINVWGVGTRLATAYDQPALGGVYKLAALKAPDGEWVYRIKLSEQTAKVSTPGILQVRRFSGPEHFLADAIYNQETGCENPVELIDPLDSTRIKRIPPQTAYEDLLVPVFRQGSLVFEVPQIHHSRARVQKQLNALHPGIRRLVHPHEYPVGLEATLYHLKTRLILEARGSGA